METRTESQEREKLEALYAQYQDLSPDGEFVAAAGRDYGWVRAWKLDDGRYLVVYGDCGYQQCEIVDAAYMSVNRHGQVDVESLGEWLECPWVDGLNQIMHKANLYGHEHIEEASGLGDEPYYIVETRHYYGGREWSDVVTTEEGDPMEFERYKDAEATVTELNEAECYLGHNEYRRPTYTIISA